MIFNYPLVIHEEQGYWGEFPDVDGCHAQGDTLDEILSDARAALELHLLCMLEDGEKLPPATDLRALPQSASSFSTLISADVDLAKRSKSVRKNVTIPQWLDERAQESHLNFSQTLQEALIEKLGLDGQIRG